VLLDISLQEQFLEAQDMPPVFGLPVNVDKEDVRAQELWNRAQRDAQRIWMVTWYPPADTGNWYEEDLRHDWASESEGWVGERRLILSARPPQPAGVTQIDASFGPLELVAYRLDGQGDRLAVELTWLAPEIVDEDYVMFVHLTDMEGGLLTQQDRQPLGGFYPTSRWRPGEPITDRLAFTLPNGIRAGEVRVQVGWYSWPEQKRLPAQTDSLEILNDSLVIGSPIYNSE
jgi:hypothetical protein